MFVIAMINSVFLLSLGYIALGTPINHPPVTEADRLLSSSLTLPTARTSVQVIPLDSHITLNLANDGTGINANANIPIDGTMRLLNEFYQDTDLVCHYHLGSDGSSSIRESHRPVQICATSATLTQFPSHTGFKCYLYLDMSQMAFLDEQRTSAVMRSSTWSLSDLGVHKGLEVVDVSGVAIMCVP